MSAARTLQRLLWVASFGVAAVVAFALFTVPDDRPPSAQAVAAPLQSAQAAQTVGLFPTRPAANAGIPPSLQVASVSALVAQASGGVDSRMNPAEVVQVARSPGLPVARVTPVPPIVAGQPAPHEARGECGNCHTVLPAAGADPGVAAGGAARPVAAVNAAGIQSPARQVQWAEAHWMGMEVIPLTPGLAKALGIRAGLQGVVADDVTLEAEQAGFQGGDLVMRVGPTLTPDLQSFVTATSAVRNQASAEVVVARLQRDEPLTLTLAATDFLGRAQAEAAPGIPAGSVSPHRYQGACTNCHTIGTKGQLPVDQGDLLSKTAPAIRSGQQPPHRDRGACGACHNITP